VSVGHVARTLEEAGIATVIVAIRAFRDCLASMRVPRVVLTRHVMGRPLGAPGDSREQRANIVAALELLERAERVGTIVEMAEA
jgi:hypothetical protein